MLDRMPDKIRNYSGHVSQYLGEASWKPGVKLGGDE